jgi:hypothetical protein
MGAIVGLKLKAKMIRIVKKSLLFAETNEVIKVMRVNKDRRQDRQEERLSGDETRDTAPSGLELE